MISADIREAVLNISSTSSGTWHTLLASPAGSGFLDELIGARSRTADPPNYIGDDVQFRVTIDSLPPREFPGKTLVDGWAGVDEAVMIQGDGGKVASGRRVSFGLGARFAESLLVEVRQVTGASLSLYALAHYRLVWGDLIANGGFEAGFIGWEYDRAYISTMERHSGVRSAELRPAYAGGVYESRITQDVVLTPTVTYQLGVWAKYLDNKPTLFRWGLCDPITDTWVQFRDDQTNLTTNWQQFTQVITIPAGITVGRVAFYTQRAAYPLSYTFLDDIELLPVL